MEVKEIIRRRRLELGYSMKSLGEKVGVSEATISRWESGDIANMKRDKIKSLADALMISPNIIMGWEDPDENGYYIESEAKELALFLKDNPEYRILFDASRRVKKEDLDKALKAVNIFID